MRDLRIEHAYVIAPTARRYPLAPGVEVLPVWELADVAARMAVA